MSPIPLKNGHLEAVLLDAGHTLLDIDCEAAATALAASGTPVSPGAFRAADLAARRAVDHLLWENPDVPDLEATVNRATRVLDSLGIREPSRVRAALAAVADLHRTHRMYRVVTPETRRALEELTARGLRLAVVSNAEGNIATLLELTGLTPFFAAVIDSHVVGVAKPDPRIFHLALEQLGIGASRAVHVGDLLSRDVLGARRAGLAAVLVDEDGTHFAPPDVPRVRHLGELPALLGF